MEAVELGLQLWITVMVMARLISINRQKSRDRFSVTLAAALPGSMWMGIIYDSIKLKDR